MGTEQRKDRVLCLDGGGIRGLVTLRLLSQLEITIDKPIVECFDWIGGTSVGGILALAIAQGKGISKCEDIMRTMKAEVFSGNKPYSSDNIEKCLQRELGGLKMDSIKKTRVVVTATNAGYRPPKLVLFRNYDTVKTVSDNKPENRYIWEVARATSAAPSYFRPFHEFQDGGLMANNPTIDTMREVKHYYKEKKDAAEEAPAERPNTNIGVVVSVGTGSMKPVTAKAPNLPSFSLWNVAWQRAEYASFIDMALSSLTMPDGETADRGEDACDALGIPYFRFSPTLDNDVELDCCDEDKIRSMMAKTEDFMMENYMDDFARLRQLLV